MLPMIGLVVAAYVVFRCTDTILSMTRGGTRYTLSGEARGILIVLALGAIGVAVYGAWELLTTSAQVEEAMSAALRAMRDHPAW